MPAALPASVNTMQCSAPCTEKPRAQVSPDFQGNTVSHLFSAKVSPFNTEMHIQCLLLLWCFNASWNKTQSAGYIADISLCMAAQTSLGLNIMNYIKKQKRLHDIHLTHETRVKLSLSSLAVTVYTAANHTTTNKKNQQHRTRSVQLNAKSFPLFLHRGLDIPWKGKFWNNYF